jgi:hypothetical protein
MKPYNSASIPFTITATNVSLADKTRQTIVTFPEDNLIVRVPTHVELYKEAGTAYTITGNTSAEPNNRQASGFLHAPPFGSYSDLFSGSKSIFIINNNTTIFFAIPMQGFLDVATEQRRFCFASLSGGTYKPMVTGFYLRMGCTIDSGTGSLIGRLYYDEYALKPTTA